MTRLIVGLLLIASVAAAQPKTAFLVGPVNDGSEWSLNLGAARQIAGKTFVAGFANLGSTVEAELEVVVLIETAIEGLSIGPVGGVVGDWSDEPGVGGDPTATYLLGLSGVAATYTFSGNMGAWAFGKYYTPFDDGAYKEGWNVGVGLWLLL